MTPTVQQIKDIFAKLNFTSYGHPNPIGLSPNGQECLIWCCLNSNYGGNYLEIGTYTGGSAILMCLIRQQLGLGGHVYSVDVDFSRFDNLFDKNMERLGLTSWSKKIKCDSKDLLLSVHTKLDLVLIDGHHSFRYCLNDFHTNTQYMHKDTIVAFHDVSPQLYMNNNEDYLQQLDRYNEEHYEEMVTTTHQDYRIDEVVRYICKNWNYELVDIPCRTFEKYRNTNWVRGETSPFNAFVAIRKRK